MIPEKVLLDYLKSRLTVPVLIQLPDPLLDSFVLIDRTGSSTNEMIYSASFAIQSYGPSLLEACLLNEKVKEEMEGLADQAEVSAVRLETDYNFADPELKRYRYQALYDLVFF